MTFDEPDPADNDNRVIDLRSWARRSRARGDRRPARLNPDQDRSPVRDLARYERGECDDDYRQRMMMNALAAAFTTLLIAAGLWLTTMMVHS